MFFKYIDKYKVELAPNPISTEEGDIFTNDEEILNHYGYYKMEYIPYPIDGKMYKQYYIAATAKRNKIIQDWEEIEIPLSEFLEEDK